jgi:D-alanyl-D-alanine carboxypeptidase
MTEKEKEGTPDDAGGVVIKLPPREDAGAPTPDAGREAAVDAAHDVVSDARMLSPEAAAECSAQAGALQQGLDQAVAPWEADGGLAGAVLGVSTPGCGTWIGASGKSTSTVPLAGADVFRVGSITKTFVATAVLQLSTAGTLALTDPLEKWVSGFPNGANITIDELLEHTSGIYDYTDDPTWQSTVSMTPGTVWTPAQLVQIAAGHTATFAPGQGWGYSNTNYILLGMIVEKATGKAAGEVLHSLAIDEAALPDTTLPGYEAIKGTLAHGYATSGQDVSTLFDPSYAWTAGAMVSSASDLVDWASRLYGGALLPASTLSLMLDGVPTGMTGVLYGRGVFIFQPAATGAPLSWGHSGDINGYHSQMFYFPGSKTVVVSLVNSDSADPNAITVVALTALNML